MVPKLEEAKQMVLKHSFKMASDKFWRTERIRPWPIDLLHQHEISHEVINSAHGVLWVVRQQAA